MQIARLLQTAGLTATALLIGACVDGPTKVLVPPTASAHLIGVDAPQLERLVLCKAGPVGTYTFDVTATEATLWNGSGEWDATSATYTIDVSAGSTIDVGGAAVPGACYEFDRGLTTHNHIGLAGGGTDASATVTETSSPPGIQFDHVVTYQNTGGAVSSSSSTTNSATVQYGGDGVTVRGAAIVFYNVETPVTYYGNSITVQQVRISPTLVGGYLNSFTGSFNVIAFDQPATVTDVWFRLSKGGEQFFWQGTCDTSPTPPFNVGKSSTVAVTIDGNCSPAFGGPSFKKGDDLRLEVFVQLATGRVFSNSGSFKIP